MACYLNSVILMAFVAMVSSYSYDRMDIIRDGVRRAHNVDRSFRNVNGNSYTNGLVGNVGSIRSSAGRNCYDRCLDAHITGLRRGINGCSCSRFDFRGGRNRVTGRNQRKNNCNCPFGTTCEYQFGMTTCVNSQLGSSGSGNRRVFVHGDSRVNLGIPGSRRLGGHCGYLTPACITDFNNPRQVMRFTYSYQLGYCVREYVFQGCELGGARNNLFATRQGCARSCV